MQKLYNDVKIEQVVLRISILIWEMYQSELEKLLKLTSLPYVCAS